MLEHETVVSVCWSDIGFHWDLNDFPPTSEDLMAYDEVRWVMSCELSGEWESGDLREERRDTRDQM